MTQDVKKNRLLVLAIAVIPILVSSPARADAVTHWNRVAGDIIVDSGLGPLPADRALAIVQTAVYEATNAITQQYPASDLKLKGKPEASVEAAIAAGFIENVSEAFCNTRRLAFAISEKFFAKLAKGKSRRYLA